MRLLYLGGDGPRDVRLLYSRTLVWQYLGESSDILVSLQPHSLRRAIPDHNLDLDPDPNLNQNLINIPIAIANPYN